MIDRDEMRRLETEERAMALNPEATLRRRDFLRRTAYTAGLATAASVLPAEVLLREAAKAQTGGLPTPSNMPVDHFVVLMQENRSFDHYLGWMDGADGMQAGLQYPDPQASGTLKPTHRLAPDWQGCGHPDPDHSWDGGRDQVNSGAMDGFLEGENDEFAIGYYEEEDLPFLPSVAQEFLTCDRYFCSLLGPTIPNRCYQWGAQSAGLKDNTSVIQSAAQQGGFPWPNIFDRLREAGLTARYFCSDIPAGLLWGPRMLQHVGTISEYYARCETGTLPNVSFVDPLFGASFSGEPNGVSADEHPHGDIRTGQAFMSDIVHSFMTSPNFDTGALFVNYDEWGGFFDHVAPPLLPTTSDNHSADGFNQVGIRVPGVIVSPYVQRGSLSSLPYDHTSILAMIEYKFGLTPLTARDGAAKTTAASVGANDLANIGLAFDFANPDFDVPDLPDPAAVVSKPCATSPTTDGTDVGIDIDVGLHPPHAELRAMVTTGYLEQMGYRYEPPQLGDVFSSPDSIRKGLGI
jgi:phospholipase C